MIWALATLYLYAGLLFGEVSRFGGSATRWVYPVMILTWPVLVPIIAWQYSRGKLKDGDVH